VNNLFLFLRLGRRDGRGGLQCFRDAILLRLNQLDEVRTKARGQHVC
jgi:hypothetical protein